MAEKKSTTSEVIHLKKVRLSFPRLWVPKSFQPGQTARYEGSFLLDPSNAAHATKISEIKKQAKIILIAKYGSEAKIPKGIKRCYGLADKDPVKSEYDGYAGMFYLASNNTTKPKVVDRNPKRVLNETDGKPYAGCMVNASITLWVQDNQFGKRVNANLRAVQFCEDNDAFGVKPVDAEEEFEALEEGESADDDVDFDSED